MIGLIIAGGVLALAATIYLWIAVLPRKKENEPKKKFFQFLYDYFQFKNLYIESILKVLFTFVTCACIFVGFLLLFGHLDYWYYRRSTAGYGLLIMILGPIASRLVYELSMMLILLVRNVMDINNKLSDRPHGHGHGCGHGHGHGCGCPHHEAPQTAPAGEPSPAAESAAPQAEAPQAE